MKHFIRHTGQVYGAQAVNALLSVLFVPLALHAFGAAGYGLFAIYGVLVLYLALAELGVGKNLLRLLAIERDEAGQARQLSVGFTAQLVVGAALLLALPLLDALVPAAFTVPAADRPALRWVVAIAVVEYVVGLPVNLRLTHAMSQERFDRYARFQAVSGFLRFALGYAALAIRPDPVVVVAAMAARRLPDYAVARWLLGPMPPGTWRVTRDVRRVGAMFGQSALLLVAQLLQMTVISAGALLVNRAFGLAALGIYRAVFDLVSKVWLLSNVVGLVLSPRFARMYEDPVRRARLARLLPAAQVVSWAAYGVMALIAVWAAPALLALFSMPGAEFLSLFVLMAVGVTLSAHAGVSYELLVATGRYGSAAGAMLLSLLLMTGVFAAVSPGIPIAAIGWAWLVSQIVYALVSDWLGTRLLDATRLGDVLVKLGLTVGVVTAAAWRLGLVQNPAGIAAAVAGAGGLAMAARIGWRTLRAPAFDDSQSTLDGLRAP